VADSADSAEDLVRRIWITRGARFVAHRRLATMHAWSTAAIAILSAYLLIASIVMSNDGVGISAAGRSLVNLGLTGVSLLLLVLSLLEGSRNYLLRSERLHDCAVELGALEHKATLVKEYRDIAERTAAVAQLSEEYHSVLARCRENHDPLDNECFRCDNRAHFACSIWMRLRARLLYQWCTRGPFLLAIMLPPLIMVAWVLWKGATKT
jgi:hypothetical protein